MCFPKHKYAQLMQDVGGDSEQANHSGNPPSSLGRSRFCIFSPRARQAVATVGCVAGAFTLGTLFYALLRHVKETPLEIAAGAGAVVFFMTLAALCVWKRAITPLAEVGPNSRETTPNESFLRFVFCPA